MLDERKIPYRFRDYVQEPLSVDEVRRVLRLLDSPARELLRRKDKRFAELGLTGEEDDATLVPLLVAHPTLLQRPIGILGERAIVGRPAERLLELL